MSKEDKGYTLIFSPGCFDDFEGSQEELDELVAEIQRQLDTGEFFDNANEITDEMFEELSEDEQERFTQYFEGDLKPRRLH